jgi:hypothetical protein
MTTTADINPYPDIALPAGATDAGDWCEDSRTIHGQRHEIGAIVVGAWASQQPNGSVERNDEHDVYVDEMDKDGYQCERLNLTSAQARQLAQALLAAADTADGWVAR